MDSASFQFVLFGLVAAICSNLSRARAWRSAILMLASLVFIAILAKQAIVLLPLAGFLLLAYIGLFLLRRGWSKLLVWAVLLVILAYTWLKKYTFLPEGIFLHFPYFTLGLSYIFFRVLHLLIEAGDDTAVQQMGVGSYLLYTLNFTTFVSGPIQRYDEFARDQFAVEPIGLSSGVVGLQIERIIRGFFKVNVLAMLLNAVREDAFAQLSQPLSTPMMLFAAFKLAVVYPFFLYANFSGYIDIVIAIARLMRLELPENFNRPFSAASFIDFWNRWHITLSMWLKTYVYNPLLMALMRRVESPALQPFLGVICFFVTFFLIGIWHGRTSEYAIFGVLQGGGVAVNKLWQVWLTHVLGRKGYKQLAGNSLYTAFARGLTISWFAFTLFWFWASWQQIHVAFGAISLAKWLAVWAIISVFFTAVLALWEWLRGVLLSFRVHGEPALTHRYARAVYASALGLAAFIVTVLLSQSAPDIVYKAF
jgi:D-alanyl-lipoteichoic acid acyltransferase DltB (MBOAT superfamily)